MSTCERCNGTGLEDSGGVQPWGEQILVECECRLKEVSMDESRIAFEKACHDGLINGGLGKFYNGVYASELTRAVFSGWQASRAAIEIELPEACSCCYSESEKELHDSAMSEVADILSAAGIKVKE